MPHRDAAWSSEGLVSSEAVRHWQDYFAERHGSQLNVTVYDEHAFTARLINRGIGQVRILRLQAPAQRVAHSGNHPVAGSTDHLIHFLYSLRGLIDVMTDRGIVRVNPRHAMLIDNAFPYVLDMPEAHEVIDLIMPSPWLEKHIPNSAAAIGRPIAMLQGWAPPLACLMETITVRESDYPAPRPFIAEQLGALLGLAVGAGEPAVARRTQRLTREIIRRIESEYHDPELAPDRVAGDLGISKRYLQTLLANAGTSFVRELNAVRLDRASEMLNDTGHRSFSIAEIAFRCGFLDPGYFARQFRRRFDATPRAWRSMH